MAVFALILLAIAAGDLRQQNAESAVKTLGASAGAIVPRLDAAIVRVVRRDIDHAEATLRRLPCLRAVG